MSPLEALLEVAKEAHDEERAAPMSLDIQARVMVDTLAKIRRANPFKPGDLVTQSKNVSRYAFPEAGDDHLAIVVETFEPRLDGTVMLDMMIAVMAKGSGAIFEVESWRFEKYDGPIA